MGLEEEVAQIILFGFGGLYLEVLRGCSLEETMKCWRFKLGFQHMLQPFESPYQSKT